MADIEQETVIRNFKISRESWRYLRDYSRAVGQHYHVLVDELIQQHKKEHRG